MPRKKTLKLATFNVNGIGSRLPHLLDWLGKEQPDIVALQELKARGVEVLLHPGRRHGHMNIVKGQRAVAPGFPGFASVKDEGFAIGEKQETSFGAMVAVAAGPLLDQKVTFGGRVELVSENRAESFQAPAGQVERRALRQIGRGEIAEEQGQVAGHAGRHF